MFSDPVIAWHPRRRVLTREGVMSQLSKVRQSRNQWKHKATQRAEHDRYLRKQLSRVKTERDRATTALKEAQARLRQLEPQSRGLAVQHKVDLVFFALQLVLGPASDFALSLVSSVSSLRPWVSRKPR